MLYVLLYYFMFLHIQMIEKFHILTVAVIAWMFVKIH